MACKMCDLDLKKETVHYKDKEVLVLETLGKKGHNNRLMVVTKDHSKTPNATLKHKALTKLIETGKKIFKGKDFVLMSDRYSTIPDHWHMIATDFDGWDFEQILDTPMRLVINETKRS